VYSVRLGNGSGTDFRYTRNIDFETLRDVTPKSGNFKKWLFNNPKVRTFCFSGGTRLFSKKVVFPRPGTHQEMFLKRKNPIFQFKSMVPHWSIRTVPQIAKIALIFTNQVTRGN